MIAECCDAPDLRRSPYLQSFNGLYDGVCLHCAAMFYHRFAKDDVPEYTDDDYKTLSERHNNGRPL